MVRSPARTFTLRITVFVVVATLATACVQSDVTAPGGPRSLRLASASATSTGVGPQDCTPDAKLLGRFAASTADVPGTWWRLTKDRFDALGVTDYKAALEGFYGQTFATLGDAIDFLIDGVASYDSNGNGYVCAFEERGTRAYLGVNSLFLLGIADDKHIGE
jgi:hypothetical protein